LLKLFYSHINYQMVVKWCQTTFFKIIITVSKLSTLYHCYESLLVVCLHHYFNISYQHPLSQYSFHHPLYIFLSPRCSFSISRSWYLQQNTKMVCLESYKWHQCNKDFWQRLFFMFCTGSRTEAYWGKAKRWRLLASGVTRTHRSTFMLRLSWKLRPYSL